MLQVTSHAADATTSTRSPAGLLDSLIDREDTTFWEKGLHGLGLSERVRRDVVALFSFSGASSREEAIDQLALVEDLIGSDRAFRSSIADTLSELYGEEFWRRGVEPECLSGGDGRAVPAHAATQLDA